METELICFPPPLSTCIPLSYSSSGAQADEEREEDPIDDGCPDCAAAELRALLDEEWD